MAEQIFLLAVIGMVFIFKRLFVVTVTADKNAGIINENYTILAKGFFAYIAEVFVFCFVTAG